jgi:mono/diheme cytochrome c family protein
MQMKQMVKWTVPVVSSLFLVLAMSAVAQPVFTPTKDPLAGSRVFGDKGCVKCHAINGVGGTSAPDLARIQRPRTFYDLAATMWDHLPRMAEQMQKLGIPRPRLNPRETGDLIAFLFTLNYFDSSGDPQTGRRLFIERKCIVCHQVGGVGGVVGPNLDFLKQYGSPIFVATAMWNHGPSMTKVMQAKGIKRPVFTESELLDLIAYLRSVSKAPSEGPVQVFPGRAYEGRQLFVEKKCAECHSLREGLWPREGPNLVKLGLHRSLIRFAVAMWNKAPAMLEAMQARRISPPQLKAQEMADLVAYLFSIEYFAKPGDPRKGRQLVAAKGCLKCHAVSGVGGGVASDFSQLQGLDTPSMVISTLWNHSFGMERLMEQRKVSWPQFSSEEMADLVAFLQAQGELQ